ncbi:SDR family NAD(P)-dependent oxidoreductase, partial [Klebsiella pneumoniae]|nr:SDR family NAD(P)-dependent oxidoreductase [Klebsiella pneumoniae]
MGFYFGGLSPIRKTDSSHPTLLFDKIQIDHIKKGSGRMQSIKGKVALITGAGRGIGRATAEAFAKEGVHVGLVGRTLENLQKAQNDLAQYDVKTALATADVANLSSISAAVAAIREELGAIDILVNNAGISK